MLKKDNHMHDETHKQNIEFLIVYCTCPDLTTAEQLASQVISHNVAACVNILPNLISIYRWQGKIERQQEYLLLIKLQSAQYPQLEKLLKSMHPYQVPEIIAVPITHGLPEYFTWLRENSTS
jgi:periplasmic divalent cation tolerance protein